MSPYTPVVSVLGLALMARLSAALPSPPVIVYFSPDESVHDLAEGRALRFSSCFSDEGDRDVARRGMSNVVWRVDGSIVQVATNGAPGAITSEFVFRADHLTVSAGEVRTFELVTTATDLQGDATSFSCRINVTHALQRQTLDFPPLPEKTLGDAAFPAGATASSGLPLSYRCSNERVAVVSNGWVHLVGGGITVITAMQNGDGDFLPAWSVSRELVVNVRLEAEVPGGGGTVAGCGSFRPGAEAELTAQPEPGFYLQQWEDGSRTPLRRLTLPATNVQVSAVFSTELPAPVLGPIGPQRGRVSVGFCMGVQVLTDCRPSVRVSGLPEGLAYHSAARAIEGVPRAACSNRLVTVTVVNPRRETVSQRFLLTIDPLPEWARGTFTGYVEVLPMSEWMRSISPDFGRMFGDSTGGLGTLLVAASGKVSGKLRFSDKTLSFSSDQLRYYEEGQDYYIRGPSVELWLPLEGEFAGHTLLLTFVPRDYSGWLGREGSQVGQALCGILQSNGDGTVSYISFGQLYQDGASSRLVAAAMSARYAGSYTASLDGGPEFGSGYLTLSVDKRGGVKAAGKLGDGTAVSLAGRLIFDADGRVWAPLLASPSSYKGGGYFAVVEWVLEDVGRAHLRLLNTPAVWVSRNPQATAEYGAGFVRTTGLTGGWYDKAANLFDAYRGKTLSLTTDSEAPVPLLQSGTTEYFAYVWWPDGVAITAALNSRGVMTLIAPAPSPLSLEDGVYGSNPLRLSITLNGSTGVFKGSYCPWFYSVSDSWEATYISKKGPFEGVLLPGRADASDGVEGRGSFLWSGGRGERTNAAGRVSGYTVIQSYDLRLKPQPAE